MPGSGVWTVIAPRISSHAGLDSLPGCFNLPWSLNLVDQRQAFRPVGPFADQEKDFLHLPGCKVHVQLNHGARVQPGVDPARQPDPPQCCRGLQAAHAPQKFRPVGGHAMRLFVGRQESHAFAKLRVEAIACQQSMPVRIEFRHNIGLILLARDPQHPFGVVGYGDAPRALSTGFRGAGAQF